MLLNQVRQWATEREFRLALAVGVAVLVLLPIVGTFCLWRTSPPTWQPTNSADQPWRYLLVCPECGYRAHTLEHPRQTLEHVGGRLRCPECGALSALAYRRGGQSLPPGGWGAAEFPPEPTTSTSTQMVQP